MAPDDAGVDLPELLALPLPELCPAVLPPPGGVNVRSDVAKGWNTGSDEERGFINR